MYAASLRIAKEVLQNMSWIVPSEQLKESHFYPISYNSSHLAPVVGMPTLRPALDASREDNIKRWLWRRWVGVEKRKNKEAVAYSVTEKIM